MSPSVQWKDPPPPRHVGGPPVKWAAEAAALRAHPKRWGIIARFPVVVGGGRQAASMAWLVRAGKLKAFEPPGAFDAVARDGLVYARYLVDE